MKVTIDILANCMCRLKRFTPQQIKRELWKSYEILTTIEAMRTRLYRLSVQTYAGTTDTAITAVKDTRSAVYTCSKLQADRLTLSHLSLYYKSKNIKPTATTWEEVKIIGTPGSTITIAERA